ncbi:SPOSA6832_04526 [Sporobolomyces salmonicolor]|uniref:SPOSA6832_04526-mRNA-1:cds n=1 Tax=Sporidiobolus salmonicolor TaxID=5005 RepID=A0A0D6ES86_SPOSA|nr:SPOSA6832_04526 [Sporobolomyces salmonicolor]
MSDHDTLLSMGFFEAQVTKSLKATKNAGLSQALDYLEKHADAPASFWETASEEGDGVGVGEDDGESNVEVEAKVFRNQALAQYHGTKSGHTSFEESTEELKPLTEEEKAAKLSELRARMEEKKKLQAKKDAEEAKANEAIRRKGGKDQAQLKAELQLREAEKHAAQRKKGPTTDLELELELELDLTQLARGAEKADELAARKRIKEQIEADKRARAERSAREKALREGRNPDAAVDALRNPSSAAAAASPAPSAVAVAATGGEKKTYDQTRLQIRVPGAAPIVHTVAATARLREVWEFVKQQTGLEAPTLTSSFPRKTYTEADLASDLTSLGLTPSAVLMVS